MVVITLTWLACGSSDELEVSKESDEFLLCFSLCRRRPHILRSCWNKKMSMRCAIVQQRRSRHYLRAVTQLSRPHAPELSTTPVCFIAHSLIESINLNPFQCQEFLCVYIVYYAHRQQRLITQKLLLQVITKSDQYVYCRGHLPTVTLLLYLVTGLLWWG